MDPTHDIHICQCTRHGISSLDWAWCFLGRVEMYNAHIIIVVVWSPDIRYWVPVVVRAIEGVSIKRMKAASTLVRIERIGFESFMHCVMELSANRMSTLKQGLLLQERQLCVLPLSIIGI